MFITRIEQEISPGRTEDYVRYQELSLAAVMEQPGFLWDIRMMFLGNYARRVTYQAWGSREARLSYSRGADWLRTPQALLVGPATTAFYQLLTDVQVVAPHVGDYVVDRHFRVSNGKQDEFEALEAGLCDLAKDQDGFVARRSLKFLGNDTAYVRMSLWESWASLERWIQTPTYAGENDAILDRVVWTTADRYEVTAFSLSTQLWNQPSNTTPVAAVV